MLKVFSVSLLAMLTLGLATCVQIPLSNTKPGPNSNDQSPPPQAAASTPFDARLLEIGQNYEVYGYLLEKQMRPAPIICDLFKQLAKGNR